MIRSCYTAMFKKKGQTKKSPKLKQKQSGCPRGSRIFKKKPITEAHGASPGQMRLYLRAGRENLQPVTFKAQGFKSRGEPRGFRSIHRPKCFGLACSGRLEQLKKHKERTPTPSLPSATELLRQRPSLLYYYDHHYSYYHS